MATRTDPFFGFRFKVQIEGIIEAGFSEVSGLTVTTQVEDFREGGLNHFVHKLPKETTFESLVLKKGIADYDRLWQWHREVLLGKFRRRRIEIILLKNDFQGEVRSWTFRDAYPVKWTGPEIKADSNTVAFETLEFTHHGYA